MFKSLAVFVVAVLAAGPVLAAGCPTYLAPSGAKLDFVAANPAGPGQTVMLTLAGNKGSGVCSYAAEDETGGTMTCPSLHLQGDLGGADDQHITFNGDTFVRHCLAKS